MTRESKIQTIEEQGRVKDAASNSLFYRYLPKAILPYAQLARWERPIGWQLLLIPGLFSLGLFAIMEAQHNPSFSFIINYFYYALLLTIGAIAMRGAGCTYNDLVDHDIDEKVERTASRPLPAKKVSRKAAWAFLILQAMVGFAVILLFNNYSFWLSILSLVIVAIYPFMKRVTYVPQLILGICFSWAALVGWSVVAGQLNLPAILVYISSVFWIIGYDTIYAHQDLEDDMRVGVYSTARLFQNNSIWFIAACYLLTSIFLLLAFVSVNVPIIAYIGLAIFVLLLANQLRILDINNPEVCLKLFKSNAHCGFWLSLFLLLGWLQIVLAN